MTTHWSSFKRAGRMSASYFLLAGVALQESVVSSLRCLPIFMVAQILMSTDLGNVSLLPSPPLLVYSDADADGGGEHPPLAMQHGHKCAWSCGSPLVLSKGS